ncbi:hypothetical protein L0F63_007124 [Massospora cicadina]|nr:hypothetical protein L0F63_007124 [Massospora cicadina]
MKPVESLDEAQQWELRIDTYPITPHDGCFSDKLPLGEGFYQAPALKLRPDHAPLPLVPLVIAFDVVSEQMDTPYPSVVVGWCAGGQGSLKLHTLSYLSLFPALQSGTNQAITLDSGSESEVDELVWEFPQLEINYFFGALIWDGPVVHVIHHPTPEADMELVTWNVHQRTLGSLKLKAAKKVFGMVAYPNLALLHTLDNLGGDQLVATLFDWDKCRSYNCGLSSDIVRDVTSIYVTSLKLTPGTLNPNQACLIGGWLALRGGKIISLTAPEFELKVEFASDLVAGAPWLRLIQPCPKAERFLVQLSERERGGDSTRWALIDSGHCVQVERAVLASDYTSKLHVLLTFEGRVHVLGLSRCAENSTSHPALEGAVKRLVAHCQTEALHCADYRSLLLQKARLLQDEIVLLQSIGHEAGSPPASMPTVQVYPALGPASNTRSYFHVRESANAGEVELDPLVGPWLPPAHRVAAVVTGFFTDPTLLGQAWVQLRVTNLHCDAVFDLDIQSHLAFAGAQLETQLYWSNGGGRQLSPNRSAMPALFLRIIKLPANCLLCDAWEHLHLVVSWREHATSRRVQSRVALSSQPTRLTRPDLLPFPPTLLALTWDAATDGLGHITRLLQCRFGMASLSGDHHFGCQLKNLVVKITLPSPHSILLAIHASNPTLLWDFLSNLTHQLLPPRSAATNFTLQFQPSTRLIPAHPNTLEWIQSNGAASTYHSLLAYLMGNLALT